MPAILPEQPSLPDSNLQICNQDGIVIRYLRGPFDNDDVARHKYKFERAFHNLGDDWFGAQIFSIKMGAPKELIINVLQAFCVEVARGRGGIFDMMNKVVFVIDDSSEETGVRVLLSEAFDNIRMMYAYQPTIESAKKWIIGKQRERGKRYRKRGRCSTG